MSETFDFVVVGANSLAYDARALSLKALCLFVFSLAFLATAEAASPR